MKKEKKKPLKARGLRYLNFGGDGARAELHTNHRPREQKKNSNIQEVLGEGNVQGTRQTIAAHNAASATRRHRASHFVWTGLVRRSMTGAKVDMVFEGPRLCLCL